MPDITPEVHVSKAAAQAAIEAAKALSPVELAVRATAEIAIVAIAAHLLRHAVARLSRRARKVLGCTVMSTACACLTAALYACSQQFVLHLLVNQCRSLAC